MHCEQGSLLAIEPIDLLKNINFKNYNVDSQLYYNRNSIANVSYLVQSQNALLSTLLSYKNCIV
jgi:hypothetical protein